jgi:hypothetical protein
MSDEPSASTPGPTPVPVEPPAGDDLISRIERNKERIGWLLAIAITFGVAAWIYWIQLAAVIPPGGDPGNWISISYAYIGGQYPGQVNPYGYPPLLFPLLGGLVLVSGGPLAAGHLAIPVLLGMLGLTLYALCRTMLRSVIVSLSMLAITILDPAFMALFFWGAEPNLLAFSFVNLALIGLLWTARGRPWGPVVFWVFAAATVLSHSLVGLALAATVGVLLILALFLPLRKTSATPSAQPGPKEDDPGRILGSLFFTSRGLLGLLVFIASVGGWYVATFALGIPHPGYFNPGTASSIAGTYGNLFRNVLPGLRLPAAGVYYLLVLAECILLIGYAVALRYRSSWISTSVLVVICSWMGVAGLAIIGWLLRVSTDYHRFGFLLVIPSGLGIAYVVDRLWLTPERDRRPRPTPAEEGTPSTLEERALRFRVRPSRAGRTLGTSAMVFVFVAILLVTITAPRFETFEKQYGGAGHDQGFLDALNAIDGSGLPGSVLTGKGQLKWTWAVTHRTAYAPRPGDAFLFYPAQIRDAALAYYALTSHYAVTNGFVSASLRSLDPNFATGMPDYAVYQQGSPVQTLRVDPAQTVVTLKNSSTGALYTEGLPLPPTFVPPAVPGAPGELVYAEPSFTLTESMTAPVGLPTLFLNVSVVPTGPDIPERLTEVLASPPYIGASVQFSGVPGGFTWLTGNIRYHGLLTQGVVGPVASLAGVSDYYAPDGGAAVFLNYTAPSSLSPDIVGTLELTTPAAYSDIPSLPTEVDTPQVWSSLGVRFIIFPNVPVFTLYAGAEVFDEAAYLTEEFGCSVYYENSEWIVLAAPSGGAA